MKIRSNINFLCGVIICCVVFIAGCSKNSHRGDGTKTELRITAGVQSGMDGVFVRSSEDGDSFYDDSKIAVFVTGETYDSSVATYSQESGVWTEDKGEPIYLGDDYASVYGEYPTEEKDSTGKTKALYPSVSRKVMPVSITNPQKFDAVNQSDYMYALASVQNRVPYALATVNDENNTASLVFMHGMSELTFSIKTEGQFAGAVYVTRIKLSRSDSDFKWGDGYMSLEADPENRFDSLKTANELVFSGVKELLPVATDINGLVVPSPAEDISINLSLVINGKTCNVYGVLPTGEGSNKFDKWKCGKNYQYAITVKNGELTMNSVEIKQWETIRAGEVDVE